MAALAAAACNTLPFSVAFSSFLEKKFFGQQKNAKQNCEKNPKDENKIGAAALRLWQKSAFEQKNIYIYMYASHAKQPQVEEIKQK